MMKKIYSLTLTGLFVAGLSAQVRTSSNFTGTPTTRSIVTSSPNSQDRAAGDTLLYIPFPELIVDSVDAAAFTTAFNDQDGLTANANVNPPWTTSNWLLFFAPPPALSVTPWDNVNHADTGFYIGSTSWFTPAGQADDWFTFGPITIPASGAILHYRVYTPDAAYRDGYKIYVGSIGTQPTDFAPADVIFTRADNAPGNLAQDTVWSYHSIAVPGSFNGTQAYFAFQNDANDMFVLEFDEFVITEGVASVDNNQFEGFGLNQVMPNPAKDFAYINYSLGKAAEVTFTVTDLNGKVVSIINQGTKDFGTYNYQLNLDEFSSGIYVVSLQAGQFKSTKKLVVAK